MNTSAFIDRVWLGMLALRGVSIVCRVAWSSAGVCGRDLLISLTEGARLVLAGVWTPSLGSRSPAQPGRILNKYGYKPSLRMSIKNMLLFVIVLTSN